MVGLLVFWASVDSTKEVEAPSRAVTHIQNTAPAPPTDTAATTPTRLPMPTRVAVDTTSVWKDERPLPLSFFSQTAASISRNSRTGRSLVRRVKNTPAVSSKMTINERLRVTFPRCRVSRSPHNRR